MIFSRIENTVVITQERATIPELVKKITEIYDTLNSNNIVVNLISLDELSESDIVEFLQISNAHREKQSFVLVSSKVDLDAIPDEIIVVPTLQEAHDIIEMEDMERDLGL